MQKVKNANVTLCLISNLINKSKLNYKEKLIAEEYFFKVARDEEFSKILAYLPNEALISIISKIEKK